MFNFCLQSLGFFCQHVVQNVNFLQKSKMFQNFQKSFLGLFYVCFACKWCAALSSAVSSGGPEGQVARFNANSFFKNITGPYGNDIQSTLLHFFSWAARRATPDVQRRCVLGSLFLLSRGYFSSKSYKSTHRRKSSF